MGIGIVKEGLVRIYASEGVLSRKLPVFYNPRMRLNRDVCIAILNILKPESVCCALAGTGIRGLRILKETSIRKVIMNDLKKEAYGLIKKNLELNHVKAEVYNGDAIFLLKKLKDVDCVIIDPFGSPLPYAESAVSALSENGLLVATATDLGPLVGRYPKKCQKKYGASPLENEFSKELGIRILIRKLQEVALRLGKNLVPIYSFYNEHYFSIYLKTAKEDITKNWGFLYYCPSCLHRKVSKTETGEDCSCGKKFEKAGPLWAGKLWEKGVAEKIGLIKHIKEESKVNAVGFFDLHTISKVYHKEVPKIDDVTAKLKARGFKASRTHFSPYGIRTNAGIKDF